MAEQRGDGFEAHPSVDGLGGEGVSELVGVDGPDAHVDADASHDAVHGPPVDRDVAVSEEPALTAVVVGVGGRPLAEQLHEVGVQGDEPVVAELADRHAEPVGVTDLGDSVSGELAQLAGAQAGAGEHLGDQPVAREMVCSVRRP